MSEFNGRTSWTLQDERQLVSGWLQAGEWKPILGGYNALCAYPFQWGKLSQQAGESETEYQTTVETIWIEAAAIAVKHCNLAEIPQEWTHAWQLIHKYSMGKNQGEPQGGPLPPAA